MGLSKRTTKGGIRWLARFSQQRGGKQVEQARSFRLKAEAERWLRQRETEAESGGGDIAPARITVGAWFDQWLDARQGVRHRTKADAEAVLQRYWREPLGDTRLDRLSPDAIHRVLTELGERGLSPRTIQQALAVLHTALAGAVKRRKLRVNPASLVDRDELPAQVRTERVVWHREDVRAFLAATADDRLAALWAVLLWTGLRPSEALALRWSDLMLDSDVRYLRVMRTLYRPKAARHAWAWEDTKTAQARSPVPLVGPVVEALARHRDRQAVERVLMGEGYVQHDLVFSDERAEPLHAEAVSKQFQRAIAKVNAARVEQAKAAGTEPTLLPTMRLYDARHTCATLLLEAGVAMRVVQGILRHSTMMLTANTYSHVRPVVVREAMTDFENFVQGTD